MNDLNYPDFYPKSLIPIGGSDYELLFHDENESAFSHWLIALESKRNEDNETVYSWRVFVFPANTDEGIISNKPVYYSELYDCMDTAFEHADTLEKSSLNDQLYKETLSQKIS
ncbi:hypothetical protein LS684_06980 [Cytobacillus spongiae]|uniref:hypothetical protein n=1 Tax=Cytobacillus spongiae TaxID=2901381 RepID=UPI001F33B656|nr:hypothetical protein [Cytobacillus spongiae]UII57178.1 hypothetical protein LS684_06980 [Cytobacillus spongiae]